MITPIQVLKVVSATAATGQVHEREDRVDVTGHLSPELFEQWKVIAREAQEFLSVAALDEVDDEIDLLAVAAPEGLVRIVLTKPLGQSALWFLTSAALASVLGNSMLMSKVNEVFVAEEFDEFETETCRFARWSAFDTLHSVAAARIQAFSPRRLVKDLGDGLIPASLGPFLLTTEPPCGSEVFNIWKRFSSRHIFLSLVNEAWREEGSIYVSLIGPRKKKVEFDSARINSHRDFPILQVVGSWVYGSGRDVEVRHTLLTYELAREWPDDCSLTEGFSVKAQFALDAAKAAFLTHVRDTSKETLKSLSDLRKSLGDDVTKVTQQTREVLAALWKDFAIAAAAIFGKVALTGNGKTSVASMKVALICTAVFLLATFLGAAFSNWQFMKIAQANRATWRGKLYGFLAADDLRALSEEPLEAAETVYKRTLFVVFLAYLAISVALFWTAFFVP